MFVINLVMDCLNLFLVVCKFFLLGKLEFIVIFKVKEILMLLVMVGLINRIVFIIVN